MLSGTHGRLAWASRPAPPEKPWGRSRYTWNYASGTRLLLGSEPFFDQQSTDGTLNSSWHTPRAIDVRDTSMAIRVLIADDHQILVTTLAAELARHDMKVVGTETRSENVIAAYEKKKPDVVLLDIRFAPGSPDGLEVGAELIARHADARIVFFSQFDVTSVVAEAYRIGGLGYVTKGATMQILIDAIRAAHERRTTIMPAMQERLALAMIKQVESPRARLEARELEVFIMLAEGLQQPEIAERMKLSPKTISFITGAIKEKLQVTRPIELTLMAVRHLLVDPWARQDGSR